MTLLDALGVVINPKRWFRGGGTVEMIPEEDAIPLWEPGYETERPPPDDMDIASQSRRT